MKKGFKQYTTAWAALLILFNLICFVTPAEWYGFNKFGGSVWAGYAVITLAFLGQLACAYKAFRAENAKKFFYNLPLITVSYTGLILTLILGGLCMAIPDVPNWLGAIVGAVVLAFTAVAVIKASAAADIVESVDKKGRRENGVSPHDHGGCRGHPRFGQKRRSKGRVQEGL